MGENVEQYPPYRIQALKEACEQTGYQLLQEDATEAELYEHALGFLDRFIDEAEARDLSGAPPTGCAVHSMENSEY